MDKKKNLQDQLEGDIWDTRFKRYVPNATFWAVSISVFSIVLLTLVVWQGVLKREQALAEIHLNNQIERLSECIVREVNYAVRASQRMAQRWDISGGMSQEVWQQDAKYYVQDFAAISAVEWVDGRYHVRWIEPLKGNEKAVGLDIAFNEERRNALNGASKKNTVTLTPPLDLTQGYRAFIGYVPIYVAGEFNGFVVNIYNTELLLKKLVNSQNMQGLYIQVTDAGKRVSQNTEDDVFDGGIVSEKTVPLFNRTWLIKASFTPEYIEENMSNWPMFILSVGMLVALLVGWLVYHIMNLKRRHKLMLVAANKQEESEKRLASILAAIPSGIIIVEPSGVILSINEVITDIFGYKEEELVGQNVNMLVPQEYSLRHPSNVANFQVGKKGRVMALDREVQGLRKDGEMVSLEVGLSGLTLDDGSVRIIAAISDVTERKED